jgi:hypothetical protein
MSTSFRVFECVIRRRAASNCGWLRLHRGIGLCSSLDPKLDLDFPCLGWASFLWTLLRLCWLIDPIDRLITLVESATQGLVACHTGGHVLVEAY